MFAQQRKDTRKGLIDLPVFLRGALLALGLLACVPLFAADPAPPAAPAPAPAVPPNPNAPLGEAAQQKEPDAADQSANAEHLSHGRFDDVVVYKPPGTPTRFVMLLSGEAGWNQAMIDLAQTMVSKGAMVTGINTPRFLAMLERDGGTCEYTSGDMENLSHFVQAYYKLPDYLPPIMAGYSSGASFAYANLMQGPKDTLGGVLALGFCPQLALHKPLCDGTGLKTAKRADGKGFDLQPPDAVPDPVVALQGQIDEVCPAPATHDFFAHAGSGASVVDLPEVGHGFGVTERWQPQFLQAFDTMAQQLKPSAPAAPASLNGLPVIEVPPKAGVPEADVFAVLISGDGGWAGLDQEVAGALSAHGIPVIGVDSLRYFWTPRTPASSAADMDRIIAYYSAHLNKRKVLLVGYSQGADVLPFIINRLPAQTRAEVALGAVMGLSEHALFEFHMGNWVNANQDQGLPTAPEMERPSDIPMLCIYGDGETDTLCPKLDPKKVEVVKLPGGHHFGGDYERLAKEILGAAKMPEIAANGGGAISASAGQTSGGFGAQSEDSNEPGFNMLTFHVLLTPLLSLLAGILILVMPRLLNYIVAIYLIAVGALGLVHFH